MAPRHEPMVIIHCVRCGRPMRVFLLHKHHPAFCATCAETLFEKPPEDAKS